MILLPPLLLLSLHCYVNSVYTQELTTPSACDCGYTDASINQNWSDMWHMNFDRTSFDGITQLHANKDLFFSNYTIPAKFNDSFPRHFQRHNVGLDHALELKVTVLPTLQCSGVGTQRQDFLYGSFRSFMRTTAAKGTVAGMFVYHPEGEIDIELLSTLENQAYFALHPGLVNENGQASALTHGNADLDFDPSADFHEYRFDWFPDMVVFYVDGVERYRMITNVLQKPGRIMFNHWTDGNKKFSQGPATEDASLWVKNMTFFFNSTTTNNGLAGSSSQCVDATKTCNIQSMQNVSSMYIYYGLLLKPFFFLNAHRHFEFADK